LLIDDRELKDGWPPKGGVAYEVYI